VKGELAEGVVPGLLRELYVGRHTGTLSLVRGKERQSLRLRGGHIVNAHTNVLEDRLGEMLVRRGLLTGADLTRATEVVVRDNKRLGEVLVELGLMDRSGLEDAVALHVHEMLTKVFTWNEGSYAFEEEDQEPDAAFTLKVSTGDLILEAVQAIRDPDVVRYTLGDIDGVLALSSDPLLRFQKVTLSPAVGFVLSRVDGATSAREIIQMIPLPPEETQKSLLGLLSTGIIEYVPGLRRSRSASAPQPTAAASSPQPPRPSEPADAPASPPFPPSRPTAEPAPPAGPPRSVRSVPVSASPPPPAPAPAEPPAAAPLMPSAASVPPVSPPETPRAGEEGAERRREILEAWEGLRTRTHFEVLGLERSARETDVKEAYFRLAKRFHPDVHHDASLADLRDKLEAVFIRLGEAYEVLRDPRKRGSYEERLGRPKPRTAEGPGPGGSQTGPAPEPAAEPGPGPAPDPEEEARQAEEAIRRAEKLYEQAERDPALVGKYHDAIELLKPAVRVVQGKMRLRGRLALARCYLKNPKWAKDAERVLLEATQDDPQAPEAFALLGGLYHDRGLRTRAVTMYKRALDLKPDHEEAAQYLAANAAPEPPLPSEGSGLLKKLFRKP
jgi:tetratricopeptide (TPR) repeat protein